MATVRANKVGIDPGKAGIQPSPASLIKEQLDNCGIRLVVSLPDSRITELLGLVYGDKRLTNVVVSKEDEGVGICCGAYLGGMRSALIMANAGFMTTCYPLTTLSMMCRIPLFMVVSLRGTIGDKVFYQEYQGLLTIPMMETMGITHYRLDSVDKIPMVSAAFNHSLLYKRPVAVLLEGEVLDPI